MDLLQLSPVLCSGARSPASFGFTDQSLILALTMRSQGETSAKRVPASLYRRHMGCATPRVCSFAVSLKPGEQAAHLGQTTLDSTPGVGRFLSNALRTLQSLKSRCIAIHAKARVVLTPAAENISLSPMTSSGFSDPSTRL